MSLIYIILNSKPNLLPSLYPSTRDIVDYATVFIG